MKKLILSIIVILITVTSVSAQKILEYGNFEIWDAGEMVKQGELETTFSVDSEVVEMYYDWKKEVFIFTEKVNKEYFNGQSWFVKLGVDRKGDEYVFLFREDNLATIVMESEDRFVIFY